MKRALIVLLMVLVVNVLRAQDDECGNGLPCGPIPWPVPVLPDLQSPTPMPTIVITFTITPSMTPSPTLTHTPTPTDTHTPTPATATHTPRPVDEIESALEDGGALLDATAEAVIDLDNAAFDAGNLDASADLTLFFGYARGVSSVSFGPFTPFVSLIFVFLLTLLFTHSITFLLPIAAVIIGLIRRIIQLVLDFIPF